LWAVPFSIERFGTAGEPFLVRENATDPSVSRDGTLVYVDGESAGGFRMAWRDRDGKRLALIGQPQGNFYYPAISPDGSRVIVEGHETIDRDGEVWIHDVDRPSMERVTYAPGNDRAPIWMPSGREILYSAVRAGKVQILRKQIGSHSEPEAVLSSDINVFASDVSAGGKLIVYDQHRSAEQSDIWYLNVTSDGKLEPKPFLATDFEEKAGKISPDGRWLAYVSNETGAYEIYVQRFPEGGGKKRVSDQGGTGPRWSRDGKKLYYVQLDLLIEVDVGLGEQLTLGQPQWLFEVAGLTKGISAHPHYDVSADGERFVVIESVGSTTVRVVQNWFAEFRDRSGSTE
jgi:Tol biopolymer transport system component